MNAPDFIDVNAWVKFHPRACKLLRKRKNFIVIAEDEDYFMAAYSMIRTSEMEKGHWTRDDEFAFDEAAHRQVEERRSKVLKSV
jgi:hypothetical protein